MNCETCSEPFKYYKKTKNCLNCYFYVNYEQTGCRSNIPEGYYLMDRDLGIIDKCYDLCKTCSGKEYKIGNEIHMNCDTCKFTNNSKILIKGNCPETEEPKEAEKEKGKGGNTLVIVLAVVISVIVVVVVVIVIYFKCCKNKQFKKDIASYQNIDGKNISFDEDLGIN